MIRGNLAVAQSGGPTAAINASLAGVIAGGIKSPNVDRILGAVHGIEGILGNRMVCLNDMDITHLKETPSAYLGSSRSKLPAEEEDSQVYEKIFRVFEDKNITSFVYIGGNDSMDTVNKLHRPFAGLRKCGKICRHYRCGDCSGCKGVFYQIGHHH